MFWEKPNLFLAIWICQPIIDSKDIQDIYDLNACGLFLSVSWGALNTGAYRGSSMRRMWRLVKPLLLHVHRQGQVWRPDNGMPRSQIVIGWG